MSKCSYPTNGLVSTIAPDHHACSLQLHLTSSHVYMRRILSACISVTVSSYQHPGILHLHPTISHVCNNCIQPFLMSCACACKHACLIHLHQTSIHNYLLSQYPQSVLSVALATDQKSSNGCYNCTRQAGLYQPAVKMVTNICSMRIPYSGVVFICVYTLHSISIFCKFYPSIQLTFFRTLIQKSLYFDKTLCHKVSSDIVQSVYPGIYYFIFEGMFSQSRNFMRII